MFQEVLKTAYEIFNFKMNILGFSFSFFEVFIFGIVASIVLTFIRGLFGDR